MSSRVTASPAQFRMIPLGASVGRQLLLDALRGHWPEYVMEGPKTGQRSRTLHLNANMRDDQSTDETTCRHLVCRLELTSHHYRVAAHYNIEHFEVFGSLGTDVAQIPVNATQVKR
jgi:hypothetical protein